MDFSKSSKIQNCINKDAGRDVDASTDSNDLQGIISMSIYSNHTCVYWLHLPEHNDMYTQGYIGVSNNPTHRLWEHFNDVKTNSHCNPYLSCVIKKYPNQLIQTILFEGEKDVCYNYEEELRPTKNIGWNLNKGGDCPPSNKGKKFSDEHRANITKSKLGKKRAPITNETRRKLSQSQMGRKHSEEHKEKVRQARLGTSRSTETKKKLSDSHIGKIPGNSKSVKTPLGIFTSLTQAAKAHKVSTQTLINWTKSKSEFKIMAHTLNQNFKAQHAMIG